ncbi:MAG TPA: hypothetical protein VNJ07_02895 [Chitinophagales bacterium]|nr:hypothetical protein [Chitinophagales bacterium]
MSPKPLESFFKLPDNLKLFIVALIACNLAVSNYHCNEKNKDADCPVEYEVIPGKNYPLTGKWKFIGFENVLTKEIEYPPCGGNETFIILTDSLCNRPEKEIFYYPFIFQGRTLINSYVGSFTSEENKIKFSETIRSHIKGTREIDHFQEQFHNALKMADTYVINDNLLQIYFDGGKHDMLFVAQNDTIMY